MFHMLAAAAMAQSTVVIDIGREVTRVQCGSVCDCLPNGTYACKCSCEYRRPEPEDVYWAFCLRGPADRFLLADKWLLVWAPYPAWSWVLVPGLPFHDEACRPFDRDGDGDVDLRDRAEVR